MKTKKSLNPLIKTLGIILCIAVGIVAIGAFALNMIMKAPEGNNTVDLSKSDIDSAGNNSSQTGSSKDGSTDNRLMIKRPRPFRFLLPVRIKPRAALIPLCLFILISRKKRLVF